MPIDRHNRTGPGRQADDLRSKVLLKQLAAMEESGSVEILCSDQTGARTEGEGRA